MNYTELRDRMVEQQLKPRDISDRGVLEAFRKVERHKFVPEDMRESAYEDHPLPIGEDQTISQPYMVALMTQCLRLKGSEKVLEIGTGSGYQAAVLATLAKEVYSLERIASLAERAEGVLKVLGYSNVRVGVGDGTLGWKEHAPYDGIIVTAAAPKIPEAYIEQLNEGGRLVIPVGSSFSQILTVIEKGPSGVTASEICGCVFVPLLGKEGWKE
ncbi:MAG: protein-L-isoaspartate(D-aspartate) O-methyltransferase [Candidatus Omnitrophota bacterium]